MTFMLSVTLVKTTSVAAPQLPRSESGTRPPPSGEDRQSTTVTSRSICHYPGAASGHPACARKQPLPDSLAHALPNSVGLFKFG